MQKKPEKNASLDETKKTNHYILHFKLHSLETKIASFNSPERGQCYTRKFTVHS